MNDEEIKALVEKVAAYESELTQLRQEKAERIEAERFGKIQSKFSDKLKEMNFNSSMHDLMIKAYTNDLKGMQLNEEGEIDQWDNLKDELESKYGGFITKFIDGGAPPINPIAGEPTAYQEATFADVLKNK